MKTMTTGATHHLPTSPNSHHTTWLNHWITLSHHNHLPIPLHHSILLHPNRRNLNPLTSHSYLFQVCHTHHNLSPLMHLHYLWHCLLGLLGVYPQHEILLHLKPSAPHDPLMASASLTLTMCP